MGNWTQVRNTLRKVLNELGLAENQDEIENFIKDLVKKHLHTTERWVEQRHGQQQLLKELQNFHPELHEHAARTLQAHSLKYARAIFNGCRSSHLQYQRRKAGTSNVTGYPLSNTAGRTTTTTKDIIPKEENSVILLNPTSISDSTGTTLFKGDRNHELGSRATVLDKSPARIAALELNQPCDPSFMPATLFSAFRSLQRLTQPQITSDQSCGELDRSDPPLQESKHVQVDSAPAPQSQSDILNNDTMASDTAVATLQDSHMPDPPANSDDRGIEEVKAFLKGCIKPMIHLLPSFIEAGINNREYLNALAQLCSLDSEVLYSTLGRKLTNIDGAILHHRLVSWDKERTNR